MHIIIFKNVKEEICLKQGEREAKEILEKKGIAFNGEYYDDNSKKSMPDLMYKDGGFLEITHTKHNNAIVKCVNKFYQKTIDEQLAIMQQVKEAYNRYRSGNYSKDEKTEGQEQFVKDKQLLTLQYGEKLGSEFKCNQPIIIGSVDNIIREIKEDKGSKKFPSNTDLFIFALEEEVFIMIELLTQSRWNGASRGIIEAVIESAFPTIYVCAWDFFRQQYEIDDPLLVRLQKTEDDGIKYIVSGHMLTE